MQASCYHNKTCNWSYTCTSTLFKVIRLPILIKMDISVEEDQVSVQQWRSLVLRQYTPVSCCQSEARAEAARQTARATKFPSSHLDFMKTMTSFPECLAHTKGSTQMIENGQYMSAYHRNNLTNHLARMSTFHRLQCH